MPQARTRMALAGAAVILVLAVVISLTRSSPPAPPPLPGTGRVPRSGNPLAYIPARQAQFRARATAGCAQVLFTKSPGGAIATAARVASSRGLIDAASRGSRVDPAVLEGIVFVESAGRPYVIAGSDPSAAAGLTQILAETGSSLLGMRVDLARSRRLLGAIARATTPDQARRLLGQLARADDRFDPRRALAGTVRYLQLARQRLGRSDLAVVSYHMGIGNLQHVLDDYDGGQPVPYPQLYFDTTPDNHATAYRRLSGFGDQSSLYLWRVYGAIEIMRLYRSDRPALRRLASLQTALDSSAAVLHPPDRTAAFAEPAALSAAYQQHALIPLPANADQLGLRYERSIGVDARALGASAALYRGLRPAALDMLAELATRVRALSASSASLSVLSAVMDRRYQAVRGGNDPPAATGYSFTLARRYSGPAQANALQATLDRLQALNLIAWARRPASLEITVASDASSAIAHGV